MATMNRVAPRVLASSPYARLGLGPGASAMDVRRAYRHLVLELHPDRAGDGSLAEFLAVKAAYESLRGHPEARSTGPAAPSAATTGMDRPAAGSAATGRGWRSEPAVRWAGARWYWEGLWANASKRAGREPTG